jgi:hypothetical protein
MMCGRSVMRSRTALHNRAFGILEDSVHLLAPARDIEYVSALALGWPVKPDKAEATYENGLLRIEVPFKDPMEDAVKVVIKPGGAETKTKSIEP